MPLRIHVCGSRLFGRTDLAYSTSAAYHAARRQYRFVHRVLTEDTPLVRGGVVFVGNTSKGVARISCQWAKFNHIDIASLHTPDYKGLGHFAELVNNTEIITEGQPDLIYAFPGASKDLLALASYYGIETQEVIYHDNELQYQPKPKLTHYEDYRL